MTDEVFIQQQINTLQSKQAAVEERVKEATEAAYDNKKTLKALHGRIDNVEKDVAQVKNDMLTADQFEIMLENSFNRQFVRGMKYTLTGIGAFLLAIWSDLISWISRH